MFTAVTYLHRMDNVNIDHNASVPAVSPPELEVDNGKSAEEMVVDEFNTSHLPLLAKLKKTKEAQQNRDKDWLWWFPITTGVS
eukprot:484929-Ditylum_brightwellii.AAC.1